MEKGKKMKKEDEKKTAADVAANGEEGLVQSNIKKDCEYIKLSIPDRLKNDAFRFIKLKGNTKVPQEPDFNKAANFAYDDPALLRHLEKGYNYGILGGQGGFIEIDADGGALVGELQRQLPRTLTIKTPHGDREHKYIKTDEPHTEALFDTIVTADGKRSGIGHLTGYGRQVVGPGCSLFDCPECGAKGGVPGDNTEGTGRHIKCLKCGYEGDGEEKFYTIKDDCEIAEIPWATLKKILAPYREKKKKRSATKEETEYVFNNPKTQGIMDVIANPDDFMDGGDGMYRGFPVFGSHQKTQYFILNRKTNSWYSHKDNIGGYIPQLIALQEGIITIEETLEGDKFMEAMKIAKKKYGITRKGDDKKNPSKRELMVKDTKEILEVLHERYEFVAAEDTHALYYYKDGVYEDAEILIRKEVERLFNDKNSTYFTNEITNHLLRETYMPREAFNTDLTRIPLNNGLFNLETFELEPFDKSRIYTFRIPITYNAEAKCPNLEAWIREIVEDDSVNLLQEYCGYGFEPRLPLHKTLWLHGTGRNGKGAFMRLYLKAIGKKNRSSLPLEQMAAKFRFSLIRLFNKFVNVSSEPQSNYVYRTETFKKITGGDEIEAEIKSITKTISFTSFAKMFVMGNKYPMIDDDTVGFWERMEIVKFPNDYSNSFIPDIEDRKIEDDGGEEKALAGFFNWCMDGLKRLKTNNYKLSASKSSEETRVEFQKVSNSVKAFIEDHVSLKPSGRTVTQPDLWNLYTEYCDDFGLEVHKKAVFTGKIGELRGVHLAPVKKDGQKHKVWIGIEYEEEKTMEQAPLDEKVTKVTKVTKLNIPRIRTIKNDKDKDIKNNSIYRGDIEKGNLGNLGNPEEKPTKNVNIDLVCECGETFENKESLNEHRKNCEAFHKKQTKEVTSKK